jgi:adenylylsulfate kinase
MNVQQGFALWITGLPASGKSSITHELVTMLEAQGIHAVVLESDEMRKLLTPQPNYGPEERDAFYLSLAMTGELITRSGTHVIFDATANKRSYRDHARERIPRFLEIYVRCPLDICIKRDPKGIYHRASAGLAETVPGMQAPYEPPIAPELVLDCQASPETGAHLIVETLKKLSYI